MNNTLKPIWILNRKALYSNKLFCWQTVVFLRQQIFEVCPRHFSCIVSFDRTFWSALIIKYETKVQLIPSWNMTSNRQSSVITSRKFKYMYLLYFIAPESVNISIPFSVSGEVWLHYYQRGKYELLFFCSICIEILMLLHAVLLRFARGSVSVDDTHSKRIN